MLVLVALSCIPRVIDYFISGGTAKIALWEPVMYFVCLGLLAVVFHLLTKRR
ncbi:hypothetical protein JW859_03430 [bacterium]|nr:hypothetical protein [bacterium]